jgi:biotin synthase
MSCCSAKPAQATSHHWTLDQAKTIYNKSLMDMVFEAQTIHRQHHEAGEVQVCKLISIKTGACPEDCKYCSQSVRYNTGVDAEPLMKVDEVLDVAKRAKAAGATRVCMGAAWRGPKTNTEQGKQDFDRVLDMVRGVNEMGMEVCCTLGLLSEDQAKQLDEAGLYAYNHNLDTSEAHYGKVITTRKFSDRIQTLNNVRKTSVTLCSGGILGMGETVDDRLSMLCTLASFSPHPESVPINVLSKVPGTPLADADNVPWVDVVRMIATARIMMPTSVVRLSAGRSNLSASEQAMCFMAGANSIFSSENGHMLTLAVPSPDYNADKALLGMLGMTMRPPFKDESQISGTTQTVSSQTVSS